MRITNNNIYFKKFKKLIYFSTICVEIYDLGMIYYENK